MQDTHIWDEQTSKITKNFSMLRSMSANIYFQTWHLIGWFAGYARFGNLCQLISIQHRNLLMIQACGCGITKCLEMLAVLTGTLREHRASWSYGA